MMRMRVSWIAILLASLVLGCAPATLAGDWHNNRTTSVTLVLHVEGNGVANIEVTGTMCQGGPVWITGYTWSVSDETFALSGAPSCSGHQICFFSYTPVDTSCGNEPLPTGTCRYVLNGDVLQFSNCTGTLGDVLDAQGPFVRGAGP